MKIWVTGARGLLGQTVCQSLQQKNISFIGSSRKDLDLTDPVALEHFDKCFGPFTHIVNLVAYTQVDLAEIEQTEAFLVNAKIPSLLAHFAQKKGLRLLHISTDYVFSGKSTKPYQEDDAREPTTVYGQSKLQGESLLLSILPSACVIRTSWLFGPYGNNFVLRMIDLMHRKEELRIVNDQTGRPTYAPDLAEMLIGALNWSGIYHFANQEETTWHAFAKSILKELKNPLCTSLLPITTEEFGAKAKRPLYSVLDTTKVEKIIILRSWNYGVQELCAISNEF